MDSKATVIRLPRKTLDALKLRAVKRRTSLAQLIRDAIAETYHIGAVDKGVDPQTDPFRKLIGKCNTGIKDGSDNHDRDIYESED